MKTIVKPTFWGLRGPFKMFTLMLFMSAVLATSCKKYSNSDLQVDASAINVVNAYPGQIGVSFFLDGQYVNGPALFYGDNSGYLLTYAGLRNFDVTVGGTNQLLASGILNLQKDKNYSVFFTAQNSTGMLVLSEDDLSDPPAGKAKIRFVNVSPDASAMNLTVNGGTSLFTDQAFKTSSSFTVIDPATYTFDATSGETGAMAETTNVSIEAGKIYTVWTGGLASGSGISKLSVNITRNK